MRLFISSRISIGLEREEKGLVENDFIFLLLSDSDKPFFSSNQILLVLLFLEN